MTFAGIVACQIGTALAARTEHASLRSVGLFTNRMLLWGIASEIAFAAALVYLRPLQRIFGTATLGWVDVALLLPLPFLVWGADELRRARLRAGHDLGDSPRHGQRPRSPAGSSRISA